jgi:DNA-binding phage protein
MTFPDQLRPLVARAGGSTAAAAICGVSRQLVNLWLRGDGNPSLATQTGALILLQRAKPPPKVKT